MSGVLALLVTSVLTIVSCSSPPGLEHSAPAVVSNPATPFAPASDAVTTVLGEEAWAFENTPGRTIRTASYAIYTTMPEGPLIARVPEFLERALLHYTSALGVLPRPRQPMETYLLATRPQWDKLARRLLGNDAGPYLKIDRGGFSMGGRGVYYDLGPRDTLLIAAHEGWHQFVQSTFKGQLPIWLDEGVATYMEGYRLLPSGNAGPASPRFMPWANLERFETLRSANWRGRLPAIERLVVASPQQILGDDRSDEWAPLRYYAQVWAFIHFLREGANGKYSHVVERMLADAAAGRMDDVIEAKLGGPAAQAYRLRRDGLVVLTAYTGPDLAAMDLEFKEFVKKLCERGNRQKVAEGKSPILE